MPCFSEERLGRAELARSAKAPPWHTTCNRLAGAGLLGTSTLDRGPERSITEDSGVDDLAAKKVTENDKTEAR